jgi:hypothetical protein
VELEKENTSGTKKRYPFGSFFEASFGVGQLLMLFLMRCGDRRRQFLSRFLIRRRLGSKQQLSHFPSIYIKPPLFEVKGPDGAAKLMASCRWDGKMFAFRVKFECGVSIN